MSAPLRSPQLTWTTATRADIGVLQTFICADPSSPSFSLARRRVHPRPWEFEAQSLIRGIKPAKLPQDQKVLLGRDAVGLAAVLHYEQSFDPEDGLVVYIHVMAVACRARGCGFIDLAIEKVKDALRSAFPHASAFVLTGRVHPQNNASARVLTRVGLQRTHCPNDYDDWEGVVPLL